MGKDYQKEQIYKNKYSSSILSHHPREFPYVSYTYGASRTEQYKAKSASKSLSAHNKYLSLHAV